MQQNLELPGAAFSPSRHPVVGTQKDIRYYGSTAKGVLNSPDSTGMEFWSINPYVGCAFGCAYCYARYAHRFVMERAAASEGTDSAISGDLAELPPWLAFERRIFVKKNAAEVLRHTLRNPGASAGAVQRGEAIVIGTATDPYQPAERTFRVTRSVLQVLTEARRLRLVIITKSPLITRDIDLLQQISARSRLTIHMSLITLDRELARRIEPRAPTPESRLRALRRLRAADIDVGVNIMPVLPGLTDRPDALTELVGQIAAAGATHVNPGALRLRATARKRYLPFLAEEFPHLAQRYEAAYSKSHEMTPEYRDGLRQFMKRVCAKAGISYGAPDEKRAGMAWEEHDVSAEAGDHANATDNSSASQLEMCL